MFPCRQATHILLCPVMQVTPRHVRLHCDIAYLSICLIVWSKLEWENCLAVYQQSLESFDLFWVWWYLTRTLYPPQIWGFSITSLSEFPRFSYIPVCTGGTCDGGCLSCLLSQWLHDLTMICGALFWPWGSHYVHGNDVQRLLFEGHEPANHMPEERLRRSP